jgi:hypothetical protein
MTYRQISAQLGIPSSTVFSIIKKWRQTETVQRLPGSGGHLVSTPNDSEALLNIVQNSPFTDAVAAVNMYYQFSWLRLNGTSAYKGK